MATDKQVQQAIEKREKALRKLHKKETSYEDYRKTNREFLNTLGSKH